MTKEVHRAQNSKELLIALKKDYQKDQVYPSVVDLICEFRDRSNEIRPVFQEIDEKTSGDNAYVNGSRTLIAVWDAVLMTATFEKPSNANKARENKRRLKELNQKVVQVASQLQHLLDECEELRNTSGFHDGATSDARYHFEKSAEKIALYRSWPQKEVEGLFHRYDCKYWPSLQDMLQSVIEESVEPEIVALSPITDAATKSRQNSNTDFLRALDARILQDANLLPAGFQLSDDAVASIANVALQLPSDKLMTADRVRVARYRNNVTK